MDCKPSGLGDHVPIVPTVLRQNGFEIRIPTNDHRPAHVHCVRGEIEVVVEIETLRIRNTRGDVKAQDIRRASRIVGANADFLLEEWRQIHD